MRTGDFGSGRDHPFFFRTERGRGSGFCDHAQGGSEGHEDEDPFKKILRDFFEERAAEPKTEEDSWEEEGVEEKGFCVEETELKAEGEFG